jgi:hypothetical protein
MRGLDRLSKEILTLLIWGGDASQREYYPGLSVAESLEHISEYRLPVYCGLELHEAATLAFDTNHQRVRVMQRSFRIVPGISLVGGIRRALTITLDPPLANFSDSWKLVAEYDDERVAVEPGRTPGQEKIQHLMHFVQLDQMLIGADGCYHSDPDVPASARSCVLPGVVTLLVEPVEMPSPRRIRARKKRA